MSRRGFTLVEALVSVLILAFVVAGISGVLIAQSRASFKQAQDILVNKDPAWIPVGQQLDETYFRSDIAGQVFSPLYILTWDYYALSRN